VPSELEEEEVKLAVVLRPGAELSAEELAAHCRVKLPGFMVPRYLEFVEALPRTPTDKIAKHELRAAGARGITPTTSHLELAAPARPALTSTAEQIHGGTR